jgi:hypothetical protein
MISFWPPFLSWLVVVAALWAARVKLRTARQFVVPGLCLLALVLGMEAVELGTLAALATYDDPVQYGAATVVGVRLLTLLRIGTLLGFWMGVRYLRRPMDDVQTTLDAFRFAGAGWRQFVGQALQPPGDPTAQS